MQLVVEPAREHIGYVDWVDRVFRAIGAHAAADSDAVYLGVQAANVASRLGIDPAAPGFFESPERLAIILAFADLRQVGVIVSPKPHEYERARLSQEGRRALAHGLRSLWPDLFSIHLDAAHLAILRRAAGLSELQGETHAQMVDIDASDAIESSELGDVYATAKILEEAGCATLRAFLGGPVLLRVTYAGLVRATQAEQTEWQALVEQLLPEWETTNVEFKRELSLGNPKRNAEFAKDVMALANTKSSGRRFLVVGFDPVTHAYSEGFDPALTQDRLEQILNSYLYPAPPVRLQQVAWGSGSVGVFEVRRQAGELPYRMRRVGGGQLRVGQVKVRHGSQVEDPTPAELAALEEEGQRARR